MTVCLLAFGSCCLFCRLVEFGLGHVNMAKRDRIDRRKRTEKTKHKGAQAHSGLGRRRFGTQQLGQARQPKLGDEDRKKIWPWAKSDLDNEGDDDDQIEDPQWPNSRL